MKNLKQKYYDTTALQKERIKVEKLIQKCVMQNSIYDLKIQQWMSQNEQKHIRKIVKHADFIQKNKIKLSRLEARMILIDSQSLEKESLHNRFRL